MDSRACSGANPAMRWTGSCLSTKEGNPPISRRASFDRPLCPYQGRSRSWYRNHLYVRGDDNTTGCLTCSPMRTGYGQQMKQKGLAGPLLIEVRRFLSMKVRQ